MSGGGGGGVAVSEYAGEAKTGGMGGGCCIV